MGCTMIPADTVEKVSADRMRRWEKGSGGEKGAHVINDRSDGHAVQRAPYAQPREVGHAIERNSGRVVG